MKNTLSPRETEVFNLIGQGLRNAEIASRLGVSPRTTETMRYRVKMKLGASSTVELAKLWVWSEIEKISASAGTSRVFRFEKDLNHVKEILGIK